MAKQSVSKVADVSRIRNKISEKDLELISKAWAEYEGSLDVLESAIGALIFGRFAGYDALRVIHNWRTLRNYERILCGVSFKELLENRTEDSMRVNGIRYAEKFKQFWKAIAGGVGAEPGAKDAVRA